MIVANQSGKKHLICKQIPSKGKIILILSVIKLGQITGKAKQVPPCIFCRDNRLHTTLSEFRNFKGTYRKYRDVHAHISDKVCMHEEMMMNNDNVESSLLTSILLKICSLYNFCYKLHMLSCRGRVVYRYEVCCPSDKCGEHIALYRAIVYYYLTGSKMGCSLRVTRAGLAG